MPDPLRKGAPQARDGPPFPEAPSAVRAWAQAAPEGLWERAVAEVPVRALVSAGLRRAPAEAVAPVKPPEVAWVAAKVPPGLVAG